MGFHYRSLASGGLNKECKERTTYAEKYMKATSESFRRWGVVLNYVATENKRQKHQVWVVPAPFGAL